MGRLIFFVQEAARAMRRNAAPSLAAVVTTAVTVVLLGVLIPIFQTAQAKSDQVRGELNFQAEIYADATRAEINKTFVELKEVPHVKKVEFISKPEALQELKESLGKDKSQELLSQLKTNPLPASFRIVPDDAANLTSVELAVFPQGENGKSAYSILSKPFNRTDETKKIEQATSALKIVLTVITALLIAASLMLVGNTIRLSIYTRRREVEVMRLVGATRWFIRWPFMLEGVAVGAAGGLVAILILWLGKITIVDPLSKTLHFLEAQNSTAVNFPELVVLLFAAAVIVSTLGSGLTLRRFLKV
jgi:cell division transport system permease protein